VKRSPIAGVAAGTRRRLENACSGPPKAAGLIESEFVRCEAVVRHLCGSTPLRRSSFHACTRRTNGGSRASARVFRPEMTRNASCRPNRSGDGNRAPFLELQPNRAMSPVHQAIESFNARSLRTLNGRGSGGNGASTSGTAKNASGGSSPEARHLRGLNLADHPEQTTSRQRGGERRLRSRGLDRGGRQARVGPRGASWSRSVKRNGKSEIFLQTSGPSRARTAAGDGHRPEGPKEICLLPSPSRVWRLPRPLYNPQ
jgi:hypothetical protein